MKRVLPMIVLLSLTAAVQAAEPADKTPTAAESKGQPAGQFKGALFNALRSLSGMLPRQNGHKEAAQSATMGIRGAETTTSQLSPYWKDDKSADPLFQAELNDYTQAQQLLEQGKLPEAEAAMADFIKQHPQSALLANARFGQALAYAGEGKKEQARAALQDFIKSYPQHPLAADAQKVAEEFK